MARITGADIQTQACMAEQVKKEEEAAFQFLLNNMDKMMAKSGAPAVLRKKLERMKIEDQVCGDLAAAAEKRAEERQKIKNSRRDELEELHSKEYLSERLDMRSASPQTKALLYEGLSHEGKGRSV